MERGDSPQSHARVVIVSQRARGAGTGRQASSATLSLMPRWKSDRAVAAAAQELNRTDARFARGAVSDQV